MSASNTLKVLIVSLSLLASAEAVQAARTVWCQFEWRGNVRLNVRANHSNAISKRVRNREYNRLVEQGRVRARVSADRGDHCSLNHPENTRVDVRLDKADLQLNAGGRIPYCADLSATAVCVGSRRYLPHP